MESVWTFRGTKEPVPKKMTLVIENREYKDLKTTLPMIRTASSKTRLKPFKFTKTDFPTDEEMETMETKKVSRHSSLLCYSNIHSDFSFDKLLMF